MEFGKNDQGRPEGTSVVSMGESQAVLHYTCNSPDDVTLRANGILALGRMFGVAAREVLLLPAHLFFGKGVQPDTVQAETILKNLH